MGEFSQPPCPITPASVTFPLSQGRDTAPSDKEEEAEAEDEPDKSPMPLQS